MIWLLPERFFLFDDLLFMTVVWFAVACHMGFCLAEKLTVEVLCMLDCNQVVERARSEGTRLQEIHGSV